MGFVLVWYVVSALFRSEVLFWGGWLYWEALRLQVVVEPLLDQVELDVCVLPRGEQPLLRGRQEHLVESGD